MSCLKLVSKVRVNRLAPSFRTKSLRSAGSVSLFFDDRCPLLQQNCGHGFQRQCRLMNTKPDSDESELLYEGPMS